MQVVTRSFAKWLATTSFAGTIEPGDQWDTVEAWPSPLTMNAARECYAHFHAGNIPAAERAMHNAQRCFV